MSLYRELHRINQLLTLYMQRRWELIDWGGFSSTYYTAAPQDWRGLSALLSLLPADEESRAETYTTGIGDIYRHQEDYDELQNAGSSAPDGHFDWPDSSFLTPQILKDVIRLRGTGFLAVKLSQWVAAGTITLSTLTVNLRRYDGTSLIDTPYTRTWDINWAETSTTEVIRSYFLELPNMNFTLYPDLRLGIQIIGHVYITNVNAHCRLYFRRGLADTYIQLPIEES